MSADELVTGLNHALDQGMGEYARRHGLPRLHWYMSHRLNGPGTVLTAHAGRGDYADHERMSAAQMWADHLDLGDADREPSPVPYTIGWIGTFDGLSVYLWAITDEEAWEAQQQADAEARKAAQA